MIAYPSTTFNNSITLYEDTINRLIEERASTNLFFNIKNSILETVKIIKSQNEKKPLTKRSGPKPTKKAMQRKIEKLAEFGFEKTLCKQAIEAAFGNIERATEYLISGNIPTVNFSSANEIRKQTQKIVEENHTERSVSCVHVDKHELESLNTLGFDISIVLQVYIACDRDIHITQACLHSML